MDVAEIERTTRASRAQVVAALLEYPPHVVERAAQLTNEGWSLSNACVEIVKADRRSA